jgi:putative heme-binding domain-containing protein
MRFDARGRLWVVGSTVYPQVEPGQKPDDKVLILEDADGDGRCDKTTVFADGLMIPTGIELGDGGAYVGHGTQLIHLADKNGDDRVDPIKGRRVVLRGFGTGDSHQNINSFAWGPGGELWMCQGLSVRSRVETPWGIVNLDRAGIWRFKPRRMKLEGFYGSQNEPQNPWGFVFTEWGEPIVLAGNNHSHFYPVPGLVPNRRDAPATLIWREGRGRKCSGGDIVGTSHFPKPWQGALILGGYLNNAVWAVTVKDDGAGFRLEDRPQPLITSTSKSFRPVDVKFGPDGALYVCDWYNAIIGHYQNSLRDPARDKTRGRIWRVTAKGRALTKTPRLHDAPASQLLDELKSGDRWTRNFAKRVLAGRKKDEVVAALTAWAKQPDLPELALKEALGVYQSHEVVEPALLARLCRAKNPGARAYAAGVVGAWADRLPDPLALLRPLVADAHPRVRLQAVVACTYVPKPEAIEVAAVAADYPTDVFLDYALGQAVYSLKPQWVGPFKAGKLHFENKPNRLGMVVRADGTPDTLGALRELVVSAEADAAARENFLHILADVGDANDLASVLKLTDADAMLQARLLPALAEAAQLRGVLPAGDPVAIVNGLLARGEPELRAGALSLAAAWKLEAVGPAAQALALDASQPEAVRRAAAAALPSVAGVGARDALSKLSATDTPPTVRGAAVAALANVDMDAAAAGAASFLAGAGVADADIAELFHALLKRKDAAPALVKAFAANRPAADAAKIGLRVMSATGQRDAALADLLNEAAGLSVELKQLSEAEVAALAEEVRAQGDAARGAQIFQRAEMGCVACHAVAGKGGRIGPDLGAVGTAQTLDVIIGAVLEPNREVKEGYVAHELTTTSGDSYQAYVLREEGQELLIRDIARDKEVRLRKDAIAGRVQRGSVMPPGLADTLTRAEFRDLIRYLADLGRAGN